MLSRKRVSERAGRDTLASEILWELEKSGEAEGIPPIKRRCEHNSRGGEKPVLAIRGAFAVLPHDLALQVLACLSAADLTSISQTGSYFRQVAQANELWRPLFVARWGERTTDSRLPEHSSWKEKYFERDNQDVEEVTKSVQGDMQTLYLQMSTAKRALTVPRRRVVVPRTDLILRGRMQHWRAARGLSGCSCPEIGAKHIGCTRHGPYAILEGGLHMCESCGWAHICGENCNERLLDENSEQLVCPVTGRCFDRLLLDWEMEGGAEGIEADGACDFGTAGHWGRAYADGYNCASEEELKYACGFVT